jgi:hypothetical protein
MSVPADPELYERVKREINKIYEKPSAYRSGAYVKKYKELGGKYIGKKQEKEGISRWFKEQWKDISGLSYPVYRPTKRITMETPLTVKEIDKGNLKSQIKLKQKIKGKSNLPAFIKKKE